MLGKNNSNLGYIDRNNSASGISMNLIRIVFPLDSSDSKLGELVNASATQSNPSRCTVKEVKNNTTKNVMISDKQHQKSDVFGSDFNTNSKGAGKETE